MKVILLEDVKALGKQGDIVEVSTGYARNFILPRKKGVEANAANLNNLKLKKLNDEKVAKENFEAAKSLAEKLSGRPVEIKVKTGNSGKLFGAISTKEIAAAIKAQYDLDLDRKKIVLAAPIKELGSQIVKIKLHKDVSAEVTVNVTED